MPDKYRLFLIMFGVRLGGMLGRAVMSFGTRTALPKFHFSLANR